MKQSAIRTGLFAAQCMFAAAVSASENGAGTTHEGEKAGHGAGMSAEAQANNPLANVIAFNIQDYYITSITDTDATANATMLRLALPTGRVLWRATLPILSSYPHGDALANSKSQSGIGDFNLFAAYLLSDPSSSRQFGIGPMINAPTGDDKKGFGAGNWSAGLAGVYFDASNPKFQWGGLLTWAASINYDSNDPNQTRTNLFVAQPFSFFQLGKGFYTGTAPLWQFDLENDTYDIPLGLRVGKVAKFGKTVANFFIEPQYTVAHKGPGQPEFQLFMALNLQFTGFNK